MIIFGTTSLRKRLGHGRFFCPQCKAETAYLHERIRRWGHLYWIPMIPMQEYPPYVECMSCRATFLPEVLTHNPAESHRRFLAEFEKACFRVAATMALADGKVEPSEIRMIAEGMRRVSGREYQLAEVEQEIAAAGAATGKVEDVVAEVATTLNDQGREYVLRMIIDVAMADGEFAAAEIGLATRCGEALGMSKAHVRGVIAEATEVLASAGAA
jgi:uncharacterized tellurite resistance protein B-like protein